MFFLYCWVWLLLKRMFFCHHELDWKGGAKCIVSFLFLSFFLPFGRKTTINSHVVVLNVVCNRITVHHCLSEHALIWTLIYFWFLCTCVVFMWSVERSMKRMAQEAKRAKVLLIVDGKLEILKSVKWERGEGPWHESIPKHSSPHLPSRGAIPDVLSVSFAGAETLTNSSSHVEKVDKVKLRIDRQLDMS